MSFFDAIVKGAEFLKNGIEKQIEEKKRLIAKKSDKELKMIYRKYPNNKLVENELRKRKII